AKRSINSNLICDVLSISSASGASHADRLYFHATNIQRITFRLAEILESRTSGAMKRHGSPGLFLTPKRLRYAVCAGRSTLMWTLQVSMFIERRRNRQV